MFNPGNYFDLLGIKQGFNIDQETLYQNYLKLQRLFHPDKQINKSHSEKIIAIEYTANLNKAYETLKNDKTRAEYLLSLHNIIVNQEENNNVNPDPIMLSEILELSEDPNSQDIEKMKAECLESFKHNFDHQNLQTAAQAIIKLQYLSKISN